MHALVCSLGIIYTAVWRKYNISLSTWIPLRFYVVWGGKGDVDSTSIHRELAPRQIHVDFQVEFHLKSTWIPRGFYHRVHVLLFLQKKSWPTRKLLVHWSTLWLAPDRTFVSLWRIYLGIYPALPQLILPLWSMFYAIWKELYNISCATGNVTMHA